MIVGISDIQEVIIKIKLLQECNPKRCESLNGKVSTILSLAELVFLKSPSGIDTRMLESHYGEHPLFLEVKKFVAREPCEESLVHSFIYGAYYGFYEHPASSTTPSPVFVSTSPSDRRKASFY